MHMYTRDQVQKFGGMMFTSCNSATSCVNLHRSPFMYITSVHVYSRVGGTLRGVRWGGGGGGTLVGGFVGCWIR